jgi:hypothetical protein
VTVAQFPVEGSRIQTQRDVADWHIVLQKSKVATQEIFRENTKRKTIADSGTLNRVAEVACGFDARACVPSRLYTKARPIAHRNFDHRCKRTFATVSANTGHEQSQQPFPATLIVAAYAKFFFSRLPAPLNGAAIQKPNDQILVFFTSRSALRAVRRTPGQTC